MNKKGGMELSINAIVILIIAMVVLGIGILFIRGMFAKAQTTTFKALTSQETTNPASADRPLVADREVTISTTSPTATLAISVYNTGTSSINDLSISVDKCIATEDIVIGSGSPQDVTSAISFTQITGASVPSNQFSSFSTVIGMKKVQSYSRGGTSYQNANDYPFRPGDAITCTIKATGGGPTPTLSLSTTVIIKVQAAG